MSGLLYVVGTPIGHLGDITRRAVTTLQQVDRIVAEDTRRTRALLSHLGIVGKPLQCVQAHSDPSRVVDVVNALRSGQSVALVTDAGMPGISDPGACLVSAAFAAGIDVQVVPGPSAVTAALSISGIVEGPFYFLGFLPREGKRRRAALEKLIHCPDAVVVFESPFRAQATLRDLAQRQPDRNAAVCRELTKLHEQVIRGTLQQIADQSLVARGEFVIVLGPQTSKTESDLAELSLTDEALLERLSQGLSPRTLLDELGATGKQRRDLYARLTQLVDRSEADGEDP